MSYDYTNGDGVSALNPNLPNGSSYFSEIAPALRQIKKYLNDPIKSPAAKIAAIRTTLQGLQSQVTSSGSIPIGTVMFAARKYSETIPGWLLCDGRELNRVTYSALFSAISVTFGAGNSVDTFNIPNLKGRAIACNALGVSILHTNPEDPTSAPVSFSYVGTDVVVLTEAQMPIHEHTTSEANALFSYIRKVNTAGGGDLSRFDMMTELTSAGGGGAHNNMQPSFVLNAYIKVTQ